MAILTETQNTWSEAAETLADVVLEKMVINPQRYGYYTDDHTPFTSTEAITKEIIVNHFKGNGSIGTYPAVYPENKCKWLCFDIDAHGDDATAENWEKVSKLVNWFDQHSYVDVLIEDSNGKGGYHIWVFFEECNLAPIYQIGRQVLKDTKLDIECFPKQDDLSKTGKHLGNWVRIPGKHHKRDHWSKFFVLPEPEKVKGKWQYDLEQGHWVEGAEAIEHFANVKVNSEDKMELLWCATYRPESIIRKEIKPIPPELLVGDRVGQAIQFASKYKTAIQGNGGDSTTFSLMRNLYHGFALTEAECVEVVEKSGWNDNCSPPWDITDLAYKAQKAREWSEIGNEEEPRGYRIADADLAVLLGDVDWDEPEWWNEEEPDNPFPIKVLPPQLRDFVAEVSEKQNVDPALVASTAFAVLSAYLCNVVEVEREGWFGTIPPTFWCLMIMSSGGGKSRAIKPVVAPMTEIEAQKAAEVRQKRNAAGRAIRMLEKKADKHLEDKDSIVASINCPEYLQILKEIDELKNPRPNTMLFSDSTIEALLGDMRYSYQRKACIAGESPFVDLLLGTRYGSGDATMIACDLWDGSQITVDRKGTGNVTIEKACLTSCSCYTWEAFEKRLRNRVFFQGGFAQRFLYISCDARHEVTKGIISKDVLDWWSGLVNELNIAPDENENYVPQPIVIKFEPAAIETLNILSEVFAKKAKQLESSHCTELWKGWCSRLEGYVIRLATMLHAVRYGGDYREHNICEEDVDRAIILMKYYLVAADRVLHKRVCETEQHAELLWQYLKNNSNEGNTKFPLKRIHSAIGRKLQIEKETTTKSDAIRQAANELVSQGRPIVVHDEKRAFMVEMVG